MMDGLPAEPIGGFRVGKPRKLPFDWKRLAAILLGLTFFLVVYFSPPWPDAMDPQGHMIVLEPEAKTALGLFLLAATWWVFEVIPIGVTSIVIAVVQVLFLIRPAREAFTDFMDPSVWFIVGSIIFGMAFSKPGLAKRMAYKMLGLVGERTVLILLGCFVMTAALTTIMAHTAVAAAIYPLLLAIYSLYDDSGTPTRFGKGLFMGMAFVAGAGSIVTLLGAARGAVALSFYQDIVGREISFFELSYYMFPVGWLMVVVLWAYICITCPPEQKRIPGLRKRARLLYSRLGPISRDEYLTMAIVGSAILVLCLRSFIPAFEVLNKSAVILAASALLFLFKVLDIHDLEKIPWNIILLFGGAMSIGFCLWRTGAADWLAMRWLILFSESHWFLAVLGISIFVLIMTNLIMNVAAIAICLPVALVMAPYLNLTPEVILFSSLVVAGMPFLLLVGAAPNAIAYESRQFTSGQFFTLGVPASLLLLVVLSLFILVIWPAMGMPITLR